MGKNSINNNNNNNMGLEEKTEEQIKEEKIKNQKVSFTRELEPVVETISVQKIEDTVASLKDAIKVLNKDIVKREDLIKFYNSKKAQVEIEATKLVEAMPIEKK